MKSTDMQAMHENRVFHLIIYIIVLTITLGCTGHNKTKDATLSSNIDIKQLTERVMTYAAEKPEQALEMIDSLKATGLPDYQTDLLRVRVYSQGLEGTMLDSAIVIGERLIELPVAKENQAYREDLLETLVNTSRLRHDDRHTIKWTTELVALCRQKGENTEALRNEAEIAVVLAHSGRLTEGAAKIDSVLAVLGSVRKFNELDAFIIASKRKITVLKESSISSGGQIIPIAQRIIDRLTDYEQHPDDYHDGTYREPSDEDRQGYIDFYRAQAYGYMAEVYARNGESQKAGQQGFPVSV